MLEKIYLILSDRKNLAKLLISLVVAVIVFFVVIQFCASKDQKVTQETRKLNIEDYFQKDERSNVERYLEKIENGGDRTYYNPRTTIIKGAAEPFRFMAKGEVKKEEIDQKPQEKKQITKGKNKTEKKSALKLKEEKQPLKEESKEKWLYGPSNSDFVQYDSLFDAIVMETQQIYNGTPVRIVLQQSIPELDLKTGTTLQGTATLDGTERISIKITSVEGSKRQDIAFVCIDPDGMQEGIYSAELAKQLADAAKEGLSDELLDLDFAGKRLVQKAVNMTKLASANAQLEAGKKIFIKPLPKEKKPNDD